MAALGRRIFNTAGYSLLLVCSLGCASDGFDDVRNLGSTNDALVCLGDSLTEGVGADAGEDYPSVMSRELAIPIVNRGRRGDTTEQALAVTGNSRRQSAAGGCFVGRQRLFAPGAAQREQTELGRSCAAPSGTWSHGGDCWDATRDVYR